MSMTVVILLLVIWALGLLTNTTMGGLIHTLPVLAVIIVLVKETHERRIL